MKNLNKLFWPFTHFNYSAESVLVWFNCCFSDRNSDLYRNMALQKNKRVGFQLLIEIASILYGPNMGFAPILYIQRQIST